MKLSVIPLSLFLISVNRRGKTVAGVGARTWLSLLVTIPVWTPLYPANYVHMCYTRLMYQQKEHLSSLAVGVNRRSTRKQSLGLSVCLCLGCVSVAATRNASGMMDVCAAPPPRWLLCLLTGIMLEQLLRAQLKVVSPLVWDCSLYDTDQTAFRETALLTLTKLGDKKPGSLMR